MRLVFGFLQPLHRLRLVIFFGAGTAGGVVGADTAAVVVGADTAAVVVGAGTAAGVVGAVVGCFPLAERVGVFAPPPLPPVILISAQFRYNSFVIVATHRHLKVHSSHATPAGNWTLSLNTPLASAQFGNSLRTLKFASLAVESSTKHVPLCAAPISHWIGIEAPEEKVVAEALGTESPHGWILVGPRATVNPWSWSPGLRRIAGDCIRP